MSHYSKDAYSDPILSAIKLEMKRADKFYHEKTQPEWLAKYGLFMGECGSVKYIIDKHGNKLTSGYHSLWCERGFVYGSLGAARYDVADIYTLQRAAEFMQQKKSAGQLEDSE